MNNTRNIKAIINTKWDKQDKNNRDYIILKVGNKNEAIFVFHSKLDSSRGDDLIEGKTYNFTVEEGNNDSNVLVDFTNEF